MPGPDSVGSPGASLTHPTYDSGGLAGVLPQVAMSLGVSLGPEHHALTLLASSGAPGAGGQGSVTAYPPARRAVVVLIDGLGFELLTARAGHAPYLRSLLPQGRALTCGFPSTTATSMGTFGTGLPPGAHGLVGFEVLDPDRDLVFNELSWDEGPVPEDWQPHDTVFETASAQGVAVTRIGPGFFDGSGLTRSALRGGRFVAARELEARVDATLAAVRASPRALVYLYWGDLDKVGHFRGCGSWEWLAELESIDAQLARLAESLPSDTAMYVTADHGMLDCPFEDRLDVAHEPELAAGVRHVGGEARARMLYCEPGALADVTAAWRQRLGTSALIRTREEVLDGGWYGAPGAVRDAVRARIGDVLVAMIDPVAVVDSRRDRPELLALLGLHGSLTPVEVAIPLLTQPPRQPA